jgi:3-hydroxybutyryl-CoA dehydratase
MTALLNEYFDKLSVGQSEVTRARTITEADVVQWCALTGDWFLMHSDKEYAAKSVFGQRLVPGVQLVAYAGGLAVPPDTTSIVANYGMDAIRFPRPTFIGDTVRCVVSVAELSERDENTGVATYAFDMRNQNDETVMLCKLKVLVWRREDSDATLH